MTNMICMTAVSMAPFAQAQRADTSDLYGTGASRRLSLKLLPESFGKTNLSEQQAAGCNCQARRIKQTGELLE
jgi:hypothetical protein